ncbi:MAG TPA: sulfotransferase [Lacipirellula sp.]
MSVVTKPAKPPAAERATKNPLAWYMPRFWHGMRLSSWLAALARNRFAISPARIPMCGAITGFTALNSVLAGLDRFAYGRKIDAVEIAKPPLFILGHWRAGTTFLHELLIRDPEHTYFTTYQCFTPHHFVLTQKRLVPWIGMFVPERRPMDNMAAGWDRPMEDEFALQSLGVPTPYLCSMFPNRGAVYPEYLSLRELSQADRERWKRELMTFCKRLTFCDNRRIVIKSPAHTARVRTLLEMFPEAKFVHIARNPYALYRSTLGLWRSLNAEEGLQTVRDERWLGTYVIDSLKRMYDAYLEDRDLLRDDQLVELRYEDLVPDPKAQLRSIYEKLDLGDFSRVEPALDEHLHEVRDYRKNRHTIDDETSEMIRREWARYFDEFGYE